MPAGQQVALQPALAQCARTGSPSPGRRARGARRPAAISRLPRLVGHLEHRAEPVGRGLVRAERAGSCVAGLRRDHVAQAAAEHPGRLGRRRAGRVDRARRSRGSPAGRRSRSSRPPLACGLALIRRSPRGASAASSGRGRRRRRTAPPAGSDAHPVLELAQVLGIGPRPRPAAPGASARCPRPAGRRPSSGPVQPFGVRSTIIGHARPGQVRRRLRRAPAWIGRGSAPIDRVGIGGRASCRCTAAGRRPSTVDRLVAVAAQQRVELVVAGSGPAPSGWRSCSRSGAGSAAPRRRAAGLRNLLECQLAASGPVSASPSPTTQATIRSGLSNAAP